MDYYNELIDKLKELLHDDSLSPIKCKADVSSVNFLQLRDAILTIGDICEEDDENEIYIACIKSGLGKLGHTYIAVRIINATVYIVAYAKEGLINQHMAEKSSDALIDLLKKKSSDKLKIHSSENVTDGNSKRRKPHIGYCILLAFLVIVSVIYYIVSVPFSKSTEVYNFAVSQYNSVVDTYNQKSTLAFLDNLNGFADEVPTLPPIKTNFGSLLKSFLSGNTTRKINADVQTLSALTEDLQEKTQILDQIVNPDSAYIVNCLRRISSITDIGCITPDNDPNQMLGKNGGYTGCVYFSLAELEKESADNLDAVARGTDGGGAVEIFATKEDALARCDYFNQFKNTLLYSGSYAAVGTLVIRTSYCLENDQQLDLTSKIVDEVISVTK